LLNSVSKSSPHWVKRDRSSSRTDSVSFNISSISCATNLESFNATACSGVTCRILTRCRNKALVSVGGAKDEFGVVGEEVVVDESAAVAAGSSLPRLSDGGSTMLSHGSAFVAVEFSLAPVPTTADPPCKVARTTDVVCVGMSSRSTLRKWNSMADLRSLP
jgi:hypothetical protein